MADIRSKVHEIYSLELLSGGQSGIHRLHPLVKILGVLTYIVAVVSFDRYALSQLVPYIFFPVLLMALAEIPYSMILKRTMIALPFCLFAGFSNLIVNTTPVLRFGGVTVSAGLLSLIAIVFRTLLSVSAVLILVAVTPFSELTAQLRRFHVPRILVMLLEMTYRYIGALLEEVSSMYTAYRLRGDSPKGIELRHMGSFVGQLLIRSFDRAERVYSAMQCRGYTLDAEQVKSRPLQGRDWVFLCTVCGLSVLFRCVDFTQIIGRWFL
ncbi:MAG: cobalt ECF transporter T component CbiQ [Oscillospiraceae bacterium]